MVKSPLWTLVVLSLLSFTAGFTTRYLFFEGNKLIQQPQSVEVKELKKDAVANDIAYQKQINDLNKQNIELQFQLQVSQSLLDETKDSTKEIELKIRRIIEHRRKQRQSDDKLAGVLSLQNPERDKPKIKNGYVAIFDDTPCDSLINEVQNYITGNHRKDSVYEVQLAQFDSVVSVKNRIIEADQTAYSSLYNLFQKATSDKANLSMENKSLKKQFVRQRVKSKVLTAALFVLSGFTANYILRH